MIACDLAEFATWLGAQPAETAFVPQDFKRHPITLFLQQTTGNPMAFCVGLEIVYDDNYTPVRESLPLWGQGFVTLLDREDGKITRDIALRVLSVIEGATYAPTKQAHAQYPATAGVHGLAYPSGKRR